MYSISEYKYAEGWGGGQKMGKKEGDNRKQYGTERGREQKVIWERKKLRIKISK